MIDFDYTGHRLAYRCDVCGALLAPGKRKGWCGWCWRGIARHRRDEPEDEG